MSQSWSTIRDFYAELIAAGLPLETMHGLVEQIESSRYRNGVYGWTSMHDLAISHHPIDFRYLDTLREAKQWTRMVHQDHAFPRLQRFFEQLHWFGRA